MIKNYFKTAWRSLSKHKSYSSINVFGLTLGIASCLVIFLVVQYELGYDKFYSRANRTYRVTLNAIDFNPSVSMAVVPALRNDFPDLEAVSQVWFHESAFVKIHSVLNDLTGFATAAFIAWKLTVNKVMINAPEPAAAKIHQDISVLYSYFCNHS